MLFSERSIKDGVTTISPVSNYFLHNAKPRSQITPPHHTGPLYDTPKCHFFRGPAPLARAPFSSLSAPAHTQANGLCVVFLPAISAFQRHSPYAHHTASPPLMTPFRCSPAPAVAPSGCVFNQRTGCLARSACGLGYPHQVWWAASPHVHT
jgi:hypothetical protein